jgi:hypothetical protein
MSEWPKRRTLYRGQDNEEKPRPVSGTEGRGEARKMSRARGWQTRGDGRRSTGPPSRTRETFRDAVPYTPLCAPDFRQPASNTSRRATKPMSVARCSPAPRGKFVSWCSARSHVGQPPPAPDSPQMVNAVARPNRCYIPFGQFKWRCPNSEVPYSRALKPRAVAMSVLTCPNCKNSLPVPFGRSRSVECPTCKTPVSVPHRPSCACGGGGVTVAFLLALALALVGALVLFVTEPPTQPVVASPPVEVPAQPQPDVEPPVQQGPES